MHWADEERWELIHGIPYPMSPTPSRKHQEIVGKLGNSIYNYLADKPCSVYFAPFDVRLAESYADNHLIDTVVQPDLSVFCDSKKLDDKGAVGEPDWIIEILSPATKDKDMNTKLLLYQKYGVREYWIVDPEKEIAYTYTLDKTGKYPEAVENSDKVKSISPSVFKDFRISLEEILSNT
ncbi:MAG: Uma2 family endonuclease [Bacteroidota bacterium]